jgi:hypothetical protein
MKTGPDTLRTVENVSGSAKHENWTLASSVKPKQVRDSKIRKHVPTSSVPQKISPVVQNMKARPDTLDTAENDSGSANMKIRPCLYCRK